MMAMAIRDRDNGRNRGKDREKGRNRGKDRDRERNRGKDRDKYRNRRKDRDRHRNRGKDRDRARDSPQTCHRGQGCSAVVWWRWPYASPAEPVSYRYSSWDPYRKA